MTSSIVEDGIMENYEEERGSPVVEGGVVPVASTPPVAPEKELDRQARVIARPYIREEREACAKIVEDMIIGREELGRTGVALTQAAKKIRNRA